MRETMEKPTLRELYAASELTRAELTQAANQALQSVHPDAPRIGISVVSRAILQPEREVPSRVAWVLAAVFGVDVDQIDWRVSSPAEEQERVRSALALLDRLEQREPGQD